MSERISYFDYLKALAIYMVVLGHVLTNCMTGGFNTGLCVFLYAVHIPLFLSISAMFAKDKKMDGIFWCGLLKRFVVPYFIWELVLTIFYLGFSGLKNNDFGSIVMSYLLNLKDGLWFFRAYLLTYILWLSLQRLSNWPRLFIGTVILILCNYLAYIADVKIEILSLVLYTYTIYGAAVCLKPYVTVFSLKKNAILWLLFFSSIIFMKSGYDYFSSSFFVLASQKLWWVFIIRFVAGLAFSLALINLSSLVCWGGHMLFQNIGQRTLQIYMLQALIIEGVLPRILHLNEQYLARL